MKKKEMIVKGKMKPFLKSLNSFFRIGKKRFLVFSIEKEHENANIIIKVK